MLHLLAVQNGNDPPMYKLYMRRNGVYEMQSGCSFPSCNLWDRSNSVQNMMAYIINSCFGGMAEVVEVAQVGQSSQIIKTIAFVPLGYHEGKCDDTEWLGEMQILEA